MTEHSALPRTVTTWAIAVTAACLPLYVVRWRVGPIPTTLLENMILVTVVAYCVTLWTERRLPAARTFLDIPIALLLVAGIVGIVVAPDHTKALGIYRAYFIEAIAMYYVTVDMIRTRHDVRTVLLVAAIGSSLFALGQIIIFAIAFANHAVQLGDAPAFLNTSPNSVAIYLEPPMAFAIGFLLFPSSPRERWLGLMCLVFILPATVLTLSRAGYLSMAVLGVVLVFTLPNRRLRFVAVGVLAAIALVVLEVPIVNHRLNNLAHSVTLRSSLYSQALSVLEQRPIFGAGISGFPIRVATFRPPNQPIHLYPDNLWLTTWSELGLLGVISFAVIFFSLLWLSWRALAGAGDIWKPVMWGVFGALVLYLVHGLFDSPYWKNDLSVEFWLMAALGQAAIRGAAGGMAKSAPPNERRGRTPAILTQTANVHDAASRVAQPRDCLPRRFTILALAVTAACLPLYVVRWHIGPLPTTLLETLILITVAGYIATLWTERRLPAAGTAFDIPIALLLLAGVVGIAVAPDHTRALGIYRAYFLEAIACFYIAVDLLRTREGVLTLLLGGATGSCLMAVGQIASFGIVLVQHRLQLGDAPAFLNMSANAVAMYLEPPLAFAAGFTVFASRPKERWISAGVLALLLAANILTLSRASYLAMAVLAAVLVLSLQSGRWRLRAVGAVAVLGLAVLEIPIINHRLLDLAHTVTNRTTLYRETFEMLSQRPIEGAGISGFPVRLAPFRPANLPVQLYPHDMWLTTWSELGLLGLVSFAVIFFGLLWRGARAVPNATDIYLPVLWGAIGALVLYLVHGLFDSPYWKNDLSVEFWIVAALLVVADRATRSRGAGAGSERPAVP